MEALGYGVSLEAAAEDGDEEAVAEVGEGTAAAVTTRSSVEGAAAAALCHATSCHLFVHDATETFIAPMPASSDKYSPPACRPTDGCDLVVSNPPWGKKFGKPEDGAPIVLNTVRQLPSTTTMLWLVNKSTRQALEAHPSATVLQVVRLGGVDAVLMHGAEGAQAQQAMAEPAAENDNSDDVTGRKSKRCRGGAD